MSVENLSTLKMNNSKGKTNKNSSQGSKLKGKKSSSQGSKASPPLTGPTSKSSLSFLSSRLTMPQSTASAPPPPDPLFVLRGTESCAITSLQFLSPALRLDELTPSYSELLTTAYLDNGMFDGCAGGGGRKCGGTASIVKLPPPGFLSPTTHIAAGMQNGRIIIWDLKTKQQTLTWMAHLHSASVVSLKTISPTELVSLGRNDAVKHWSIEPTNDASRLSRSHKDTLENFADCTAVCKAEIPMGDYVGFAGCDVFKDGPCVVVAMPGPTQDAVSIWKLNGKNRICELRVNEISKVGSVMHLKWVEKKGKVTLLVAYESGDLCLWDWCNRDLHSVATVKDNPVCLEYDQSLGSGIIGTVSEKVYIFTITNSLDLSVVKEISVTNEGIGSCISRPDSKIYVTGGWDNRIRVFSWQKHKPLAVLNFHKSSVACLHYAPSRVVAYEGAGLSKTDNKQVDQSLIRYEGSEHLLAAGSTDGSVSLWNIY